MRGRFWRIAMFSLLIFGLGCVGCAKPPTSRPAIPPPTKFADESSVYAAATTTSELIRVPHRFSPREFVTLTDLKDVYFAFEGPPFTPRPGGGPH